MRVGLTETEESSWTLFTRLWWRSFEHCGRTIVEFFFCYLSKWECKNIFVILSHSLVSKFTWISFPVYIFYACWSNPIMMIWQIFSNNIYYNRAHLIFIRLLLVADGHVTGMEVHIDVVVTGNAPTALLYSCNTLELQVGIATMVPLLSRRRKAINPPIHINSPQEGAWHDAPCCKRNDTDICR